MYFDIPFNVFWYPRRHLSRPSFWAPFPPVSFWAHAKNLSMFPSSFWTQWRIFLSYRNVQLCDAQKKHVPAPHIFTQHSIIILYQTKKVEFLAQPFKSIKFNCKDISQTKRPDHLKGHKSRYWRLQYLYHSCRIYYRFRIRGERLSCHLCPKAHNKLYYRSREFYS